ncbi:hypothetical protein [Methanoregula sp.]|uniref:hypothetical protein n=1 Tax=Methanoregula sp. TaxID=2052170 RepID=UPI00236B7039|nr:hypothetical protein [Methanoregula sp.]MDD1686528.1 hypothetical protein [Methanoregula sp.]
MTEYPVIGFYGNYRPTRTFDNIPFEDPETWRARLYGHIDFRLQNTFVESSLSEFIFNFKDIVGNTINAATIEQSLLYLQHYLGFRFSHPGEVIDYLQKHRGIYDLTLYACTLTEEEFGSRAQISLELYKDPEIDDQYLTIYVRQNEYEPDIIKKIDAICKEYASAMTGEEGYILVTTDFHPPLE